MLNINCLARNCDINKKKLEHNKFYNVKIIKVDNCNVYGEVE